MKWKNRGMGDSTRDKNREMVKRYRTKTNYHHSSGEDNQEGCWSELPYEILDMIIKRIFVIDLINVRAVCKSWRNYSYDKFQPLKQIPWRLVFDYSPTGNNSSCKLIDPTNKKTYIVNDTKIKLKKLYDMKVHDSKCGWVLMSSQSYSGTCFLLYTPFLAKNNIIQLPVLNSKFLLATFSSAPSLGTPQDDCVFLAIDNSASREGISISTCRRGDHTWRTQHFECFFPLSRYRSKGVMSVVYSQGVFYCPSCNGSIGSFNIDRQEWVILETEHKLLVTECLKICPGSYIHLVKSDHDGGFLLVVRWDCNVERRAPVLKVFRLDRSKLVWEKLASLGGRALFIASKGSSFVMELPKWEGTAFLCSTKEVSLVRVHLKQFYGHERYYHCTKLYGSHRGNQNWIEPFL